MNAPVFNLESFTEAVSPKISVIISAYNNFDALVRALPFWQAQSISDFEIIIADDGSESEQVRSFQHAAEKTALCIRHVWQADMGFDKCGILNKAILIARAERLLFVDADMMPRFDLIENHIKLLKLGRYISGGSHVNLNPAGQVFLQNWRPQDARQIFNHHSRVATDFVNKNKTHRICRYGLDARISDFVTWRQNAFSGANASCWKQDALRVNGFDEEWGYGGLDRDFGIRLTNAGVDSRRHQYSLVALHQEHPRPYKNSDQVKRNKKHLLERIKNKITWVKKGLDSHLPESIQVVWAQS